MELVQEKSTIQVSKIAQIFSIFNDGVIAKLSRSGDDVNLMIEIPHLAEVVDSDYWCFYCTLKSCDSFYLKDRSGRIYYYDLDDILDLQIVIYGVINTDENIIKVDCEISDPYINGPFSNGLLYIEASDMLIYDQDFTHISFDDLNAINIKYWDDFEI